MFYLDLVNSIPNTGSVGQTPMSISAFKGTTNPLPADTVTIPDARGTFHRPPAESREAEVSLTRIFPSGYVRSFPPRSGSAISGSPVRVPSETQSV